MNNTDLIEYIRNARAKNASNDDIKAILIAGGWPTERVDAALSANLDLPSPPPPPDVSQNPPLITAQNPVKQAPVAVVQSLSTRGFEYIIMFISLWFTASALGWILHNLVDGLFGESGYYESLVSFSASALIVALPVFSIMFLRLKKAEQSDPLLTHDPSRRKAIQLTLVVTFLIGMLKIMGYIFSLLNGESNGVFFNNSQATNPLASLVHTLITLFISGSIFAYWWRDQHKTKTDL